MPETPSFKLREPPPPPGSVAPCELAYAELDVVSNFSFLRGASHADELVYTAANLGYRAIAITDVCTLAGMVRAHSAAKQCGMNLIVGCRLKFADGSPDVLVWVQNRIGYANLCKLLTLGKRRTEKGKCELYVNDLVEHAEGLIAGIDTTANDECRSQKSESNPNDETRIRHSGLDLDSDFGFRHSSSSCQIFRGYARDDNLRDCVSLMRRAFKDRIYFTIYRHYGIDDESHIARTIAMSEELRLPLLATNHAHYHDSGRRELQDVLVCVREKTTIDQAGYKLFANAERHLKSPPQMHRLFAECPTAVRATMEVANQCSFSMDELKYEYPDELVPEGKTPKTYLRELTWNGAAERFASSSEMQETQTGMSVPQETKKLIEYELALIEQLGFEAYFLTVYDLVRFARSRGILCQGRGSAANSAVCYCLGITSVDPSKIDLLFERFISAERNEYPDIDVDFEHERREEVLQYLYQKYGRHRAGMAAVVITYRGRSAIRDVGKALGLSLDMVDSMAKKLDWWHRGVLNDEMVRETGLDPHDPTVRRVLSLASELLGFPRHLGQHVGGMVMTRGPLCEVVPIENAAMEDRTVIEWDKDDIEELGILKVDCLGLGMLTCISKAFSLLKENERRRDKETKWLLEGAQCGKGKHVSRSGCMEKEHDACKGDLSGDSEDAGQREIRNDGSDASLCGIDSFEHCRRVWQTKSSRPSQISADCTRIPERVGNATGTCFRPSIDPLQPVACKFTGRDGPGLAWAHSKFGTKDLSSSHFVSCSLDLSVSSRDYELHTIPQDDPAVYDMICNADTIGVFQIESRAQMSMLPRLRPRNFYDLVIEVAIVRPGPIQGNMVHPYLRRRNGEEKVDYPSEGLKKVLHKTLGVPLFQEQAMRVAMVAAGFSAAEADQLRRAMAAWKKSTKLLHFQERIINGMLKNGYTLDFAHRTFEQIKGFGEYGFPESHSASFALLVYVSAWLKCHHPAAFAAALINSQPMGFYQPAQIVRDAREHGVEVRGVDVNASEWDCTLEVTSGGLRVASKEELPIADCRLPIEEGSNLQTNRQSAIGNRQCAMRLGFRLIKGFRQADAETLVAARAKLGVFRSIDELHQATGLKKAALRKLAEADAFTSLRLSRREALWQVMALSDEQMPLYTNILTNDEARNPNQARNPDADFDIRHSDLIRASDFDIRDSNSTTFLPKMPLSQQVLTDYCTTGLSLKQHPVALVRDALTKQKVITAKEMTSLPHGRFVRVAGMVLIRQRPGTASGIVFITLEDETGIANLIVRPNIFDQYRPAARHAALLQCDGYVERQGQVVHVMAKRLFDRSELIRGMEFSSRDFH